jgi:hypothetical protein
LEGGTERTANTVQTTCFLGPKKRVRGDGVDGRNPFMIAAGNGTILFNFPGLFFRFIKVDDGISVLSVGRRWGGVSPLIR